MSEQHRPPLTSREVRSYDEFETSSRRRKKGRGLPPAGPDASKISDHALREAALGYLDRQDASVEQVRRILLRRIAKYGDADTSSQARSSIEALLGRLQESGILDDERYARMYAESLRRRGGSLPKLRQKLRARGLSDEHLELALSEMSKDDELSDESSAATYARKRRLRERYDLGDPKQREKALAALARQGFSFDVAKRVLGL